MEQQDIPFTLWSKHEKRDSVPEALSEVAGGALEETGELVEVGFGKGV